MLIHKQILELMWISIVNDDLNVKLKIGILSNIIILCQIKILSLLKCQIKWPNSDWNKKSKRLLNVKF